MRLARLERTVEAVVRMHPGVARRGRAAIAADDGNARGNAAALLVANVERQARLRGL